MPAENGGEGTLGAPFNMQQWLARQGSGENTPMLGRLLSNTATPQDFGSMGFPGMGAPTGPTGTPDTPAGAPTPAVDPFTQLINMILRSQLQESLGNYFNPTGAMPGAGSSFTPGQTMPVAGGAPNVGAMTAGSTSGAGLPQPNPAMLPGGGVGAPAPAGGFTPGLPDPTASAGYAFQPPSQTPPGISYGQGPAGINQGWQQFLGGLGIQGLPQPSMAGGGSMLMGA